MCSVYMMLASQGRGQMVLPALVQRKRRMLLTGTCSRHRHVHQRHFSFCGVSLTTACLGRTTSREEERKLVLGAPCAADWMKMEDISFCTIRRLNNYGECLIWRKVDIHFFLSECQRYGATKQEGDALAIEK